MGKEQILKYDNYFFDLDGTLVDSRADVLASLKKSYQSLDLDFDEAKLVIGPGLEKIIDIISPHIGIEIKKEIIKNFKKNYLLSRFKFSKLYPGVLEFLDLLKAEGKKIFLATNKPLEPAKLLLETKNILDYFIFLGCSDFKSGELRPKGELIAFILEKYQLSPSKSIMLGDTLPDIEAAKKNSLASLAFCQGYGGEDFAKNSGADFSIDSYYTLLN